jgi:hypothetical protein
VAILFVKDGLRPIALYEGKAQTLQIFTRLGDGSRMSADDHRAQIHHHRGKQVRLRRVGLHVGRRWSNASAQEQKPKSQAHYFGD